jgi:hypothetical protein
MQSLGLAQTAPPPRADAQHVSGRAAGAAGKTWNRGTRGCSRDGDSRWVAEVLLSDPTPHSPHTPPPPPNPDHAALEDNRDGSSGAAAAAAAAAAVARSAPELETRAHDEEGRCE